RHWRRGWHPTATSAPGTCIPPRSWPIIISGCIAGWAVLQCDRAWHNRRQALAHAVVAPAHLAAKAQCAILIGDRNARDLEHVGCALGAFAHGRRSAGIAGVGNTL